MAEPTQPTPPPEPRRSSAEVKAQVEVNRRGPFGTFLRWILGPLWYWFDLYDWSSGHPDHWKIIATVGYVFGLVLLALVLHHAFGVHDGDVPMSELVFIGTYSALVFLVPYGMKGIKLWLDWKGSQSGPPDAKP